MLKLADSVNAAASVLEKLHNVFAFASADISAACFIILFGFACASALLLWLCTRLLGPRGLWYVLWLVGCYGLLPQSRHRQIQVCIWSLRSSKRRWFGNMDELTLHAMWSALHRFWSRLPDASEENH